MIKVIHIFQVKQITGTTTDIFLEYTQRNLPEGVTMSVYQVGLTNWSHVNYIIIRFEATCVLKL